MKFIDVLIVIIAVLIVAASVWYQIRRRRKGKSSGASGCGLNASCKQCPGAQSCDEKNKKDL